MKNHSLLEVDLVHVRDFNAELGDALETRPAELLPLVSQGLQLRLCALVTASLHAAACRWARLQLRQQQASL